MSFGGLLTLSDHPVDVDVVFTKRVYSQVRHRCDQISIDAADDDCGRE